MRKRRFVDTVRVTIASVAAVLLYCPAPAPFGGGASSAVALAQGTAPAAPRSADRLGVDLPSPSETGAAAQAAIFGAGWLHVIANWDALEPARGKFAWGILDNVVRRVPAGKHLLVTIQRTPKWAALTPDAPEPVWSHQPIRAIGDWATFVRAVASRYRGRVGAWQIQPPLEITTFRGTTRDYLELLHAARLAIRETDRDAAIVASTPAGLDLPFLKLLFTQTREDFDAVVLYPRGRTPAEVLEALSTLRARKLLDSRHEIWLGARTDWPHPVQLAAVGLAMGVSREFWEAATPAVAGLFQRIGDASFVGPLDRGPGIYAFVFANGEARTAVLWADGPTRAVPFATTSASSVAGADGRAVTQTGDGAVTVGPDPVLVTAPPDAVFDEAAKNLASGGVGLPRDPSQDFSHAQSVSAILGATNVEQGLYNQALRTLPSGGVVPISVDGVDAIRTDQARDAVYVYFRIDDSYAYFVDGRYDYLITVQVHRAGGPQRVGFNLMYDSMSGYRFSSWQWVDEGDGWASYTIRVSDASFSKTWGWDFAINGAADKKENLVVRAVTVTRVPSGRAAQ
ncbi:MAG TPA: hypothetical protein VJT33_17900 [bacterium]|nr:hypothetical protein [bacterium]